MKAVIKRLVSSVLLVLVLIASVPVSLVATALDDAQTAEEKESAGNVVEAVLDALDDLSADTAYRIDRSYTDGVISSIDFALQPGKALDILQVVNENNVMGVLETLAPVYLAFDEASVDGNIIYDQDGSVAWKDAIVNIYNAKPLNFTTVANMSGNTLLSYDLQLVSGDVALDITVSLSIAASEENIMKLKNTAAKLADIVTVNAAFSDTADSYSASIDVTVDLRDYLDQILSIALPDIANESYDYIRNELHASSLQTILEHVTLAKLQIVAEKVGYIDEFNTLVTKLADKFGLDTSDPCNYEDIIAVLDANSYYQTYLKDWVEAKYEKFDVASILASTVGDYYQNDGTYVASVGENYDGFLPASYFDRAVELLEERYCDSVKMQQALEKLGYDCFEDFAEALKTRYARFYNAKYDLDVKVTVFLFDAYTVTFVDPEGNVIETQTVVAGEGATDPDYHGGYAHYEADVDYDEVLSDLTVTLTPIHEYDEGVETKAPTCTEEGVMTYTCTISGCGETMTETISLAGHTAGEWETVKEATCVSDGEKVKKCTVCGEVLETETIPMVGHNYVEQKVEGTDCNHPHITQEVCSNCGDVRNKNETKVDYPPLNDDIEDVVYLDGILVIKVPKMTVAEFKANFYCDITVCDPEGNELSDDDLVGTNYTFTCGVCGTSFDVALIGDVNGDGSVNAKDYMYIKRHVLNTYKLEGAPLAAADINVDLSTDAKDYMMLKAFVLRKYDFYNNIPDWSTVSHLITAVQ